MMVFSIINQLVVKVELQNWIIKLFIVAVNKIKLLEFIDWVELHLLNWIYSTPTLNTYLQWAHASNM